MKQFCRFYTCFSQMLHFRVSFLWAVIKHKCLYTFPALYCVSLLNSTLFLYCTLLRFFTALCCVLSSSACWCCSCSPLWILGSTVQHFTHTSVKCECICVQRCDWLWVLVKYRYTDSLNSDSLFLIIKAQSWKDSGRFKWSWRHFRRLKWQMTTSSL